MDAARFSSEVKEWRDCPVAARVCNRLYRRFPTGQMAATVKALENTGAWQVINLPIQQLAKLRYSFKRATALNARLTPIGSLSTFCAQRQCALPRMRVRGFLLPPGGGVEVLAGEAVES